MQASPTDFRLARYEKLPHWQQDNHFIQVYYRPASYSYSKSFQSLLYLHNETVNIYSHAIPAIFFLGLGIHHSWPMVDKPSHDDGFTSRALSANQLAFVPFFLGGTTCLGISAFYHTISNHSPSVNRWGNQLDYVGIVALITGSFIPSMYYGFHDQPQL